MTFLHSAECTVHSARVCTVHMWGEWRSIELQGFGRDQPPLVRERTQPSLVMMMTIMLMLIMMISASTVSKFHQFSII